MRILLGVTGGIAAYKALELARLAGKAGHAVRVVQTPSSQRFVGALSFSTVTGAPVLTEEWERDPLRGAFPGDPAPDHDPLSHLELVANADVLVIAPASANTIAKLAHGLADNLLTSAALAATCPVVVAPAMNHAMWEHPATRANMGVLRARGVHVVEPTSGALGSIGEHGMGRLADPTDILQQVSDLAFRHTPGGHDGMQDLTPALVGRRVLVTAGGTREPIDAVRYVGNRSSGRMGFALASQAAELGAEVTVVAANVALPRDPRVTYVDVETAAQLKAACEAHFDATDLLLMAAAVADFRPRDVASDKLKKTGRDELVVAMEPTEDVLAHLSAQRRDGQVLVGFAAETGEGAIAYGRGKLERKGLDAVVVNDVARAGIGFDASDNEVTVLTPDDATHVPRAAKEDVARAILGVVAQLSARTRA